MRSSGRSYLAGPSFLRCCRGSCGGAAADSTTKVHSPEGSRSPETAEELCGAAPWPGRASQHKYTTESTEERARARRKSNGMCFVGFGSRGLRGGRLLGAGGAVRSGLRWWISAAAPLSLRCWSAKNVHASAAARPSSAPQSHLPLREGPRKLSSDPAHRHTEVLWAICADTDGLQNRAELDRSGWESKFHLQLPSRASRNSPQQKVKQNIAANHEK